ncbi:MAG: putative PEP-binding protein [Paracoccaceae bacterium]
MIKIPSFELISSTANISGNLHGVRAKCLQRLIRLGLPVPKSVALSIPFVNAIASGERIDLNGIVANFGLNPIISVRSSPLIGDWGGPSTILNIGMNRATEQYYAKVLGKKAAKELHLKFIKSYAMEVLRLDDTLFDFDNLTPETAINAYEQEMDECFPQSIEAQLSEVLKSMSRAWQGTSARLLRVSKGAPDNAGLGLVVQKMVFGLGKAKSGAGVIQFFDPENGRKKEIGRYLNQSQGRDALEDRKEALFLTKDKRGPSLEEMYPSVFEALIQAGVKCSIGLKEEMQIEFTLQNGKLFILDAVPAPRNVGAAVEVATSLVKRGIIDKKEAILRIDPKSLSDLLHNQVIKGSNRRVICKGIAASPGASSGKLVFSSMSAQVLAAKNEKCILVRRETSPEDIRGMHSANGILTERGGNTSHAAVIARGLGLPCVSGVNGIEVDSKNKKFRTSDGRFFLEGDFVTIDGTTGDVLEGEVPLVPAHRGKSFSTLMKWADQFKDIKIRANADTSQDAKVAGSFGAEGIGLCRTEHMFFAEERLTVLREVIFADSPMDRTAALKRLLPMQKNDFSDLFQIMAPLPVCLRLFDPPLHEFLPSTRAGIQQLAEAMNLTFNEVQERIASLSESNPMLGMRGVRLGITVPEIYQMQARAIFEAIIETRAITGQTVIPEIMIPLVSAKKEVELVKSSMDEVAKYVSEETGEEINYKLGVMVETPRAALQAGDISKNVTFLSFGTNDMTQMTYGLSRDDAGRFMSQYVSQGVFEEDPFHILDKEGVGELLKLACTRGRGANQNLTLSVCGEHGGNPESIEFCRKLGMDYVSCSPYRVPVARLAAAHLAILDVAS